MLVLLFIIRSSVSCHSYQVSLHVERSAPEAWHRPAAATERQKVTLKLRRHAETLKGGYFYKRGDQSDL